MKTFLTILGLLAILITVLVISLLIIALVCVIISGGSIVMVDGDQATTFFQAASHDFVDTQIVGDITILNYRLTFFCAQNLGCQTRLTENPR